MPRLIPGAGGPLVSRFVHVRAHAGSHARLRDPRRPLSHRVAHRGVARPRPPHGTCPDNRVIRDT
eukprot:4662549-Prymnesium_polylepis.1